jgi:hypothetical protein
MSVVVINNWAVVTTRSAAQTASPPIHLRGIVTGHPTYADGTEITTSHITHRKGYHLVTCNGTHYQLGTVNPAYQAQYPQALQGLLRRIPEKNEEETIVIRQQPPMA